MEKAIAFCLFFSLSISASTVVVLWTPTAAVIGTDTKAQINGMPAGRTCKIGGISKDNTILLAESGIRAFAFGRASFDFLDILTDRLRVSKGVNTGIDQAKDSAIRALVEIFNVPSMRESALKEPDKNGVQFVVINRVGDRFVLHTREFFPARSGSGVTVRVVSRDCPGSPECKASGTIVGLGIHDHLDAELAKNATIYSLLPRDLIHRLVGLEITAHPNEVGLPLDIVQIDSTGIHLLEKGACQ